jgi:hypothetical protein
MSELELHELAADWHSLVPEAQSALIAEFGSRGLDFSEPSQSVDEPAPEFRDLTTVRRYRDLSEALVARAVIESAGIFCFQRRESGPSRLAGLQLHRRHSASGSCHRRRGCGGDPVATDPQRVLYPRPAGLRAAALSSVYFDRHRVGAPGPQGCSCLALSVRASAASRHRVVALQQLRPALAGHRVAVLLVQRKVNHSLTQQENISGNASALAPASSRRVCSRLSAI